MRIHFFNLVVIIVLSSISIASASAAVDIKNAAPAISAPDKDSSEAPKSYYEDSKRGWYWYEDPKKEENKEPEQQTATMPSLKDYTKDQLWNMYPDQFQALLQSFLKKAVQYPTVENVREYFVMQDIARAKANAFANVSQVVRQQYPELSLEREFPASAIGGAAKIKMQAQETSQRLLQSRDDFAIVFFYSKTCEFCRAQESSLRMFVDKYGWEVKPVEINENPEAAARFGVETVPFLMLIHRGSPNYFPIASGVVAIDELENRLYQGIRLLTKEITPDEYSMYEYQREGGFDPSRYDGNKSGF